MPLGDRMRTGVTARPPSRSWTLPWGRRRCTRPSPGHRRGHHGSGEGRPCGGGAGTGGGGGQAACGPCGAELASQVWAPHGIAPPTPGLGQEVPGVTDRQDSAPGQLPAAPCPRPECPLCTGSGGHQPHGHATPDSPWRQGRVPSHGGQHTTRGIAGNEGNDSPKVVTSTEPAELSE